MSRGRAHWSHGGRSPRFGPIHAIGSIPLLGLLLHPSWDALWLALGVIAALLWIEKRMKLTLAAFLRWINLVLTGRVKSSLNLFKELTR